MTKIGRGPGSGEHLKKIWDPLFISATVEASDLKIGRPTQHEFRFTLPNTNLR